ncbi:unnamed protein product [Lymnaea stagnalis]|uniref:PDZ domain-containing protein n=1 Tax=Lymnaea stagnalis TaxID=6523 RepID=A0AAV2HZY4_LYMST
MIDETGSPNDERLGRLVQVFDGRKWPVVKAVDVYIRPGDNVQKVSQTVLTELGLRKWRLNKYTLAIGTTHGHVVAFLKGNDVVLKAFGQCLAKEKCVLLIKKPSQGSKKLFKTKLNMSDTQLYTQDRCTGKLIDYKTSSIQNMFQYPLDNKDKNQSSKAHQSKKSFVPIPELGIFTPEQHVLHSGTFAQHCHLGDVRNNNSSETIHNTDHSVDSSLDDSASSYGFNHSNGLQKRASHQKYDDIYHSCMDISRMNDDARMANVARVDSFKVMPIREENVKLDPGLRSCSLNDVKSVSAMSFRGQQTLGEQRQQTSQKLPSSRDNPYRNNSVNRTDSKITVNNHKNGDCTYASQKKNLPTKGRSDEIKTFCPPSSQSHGHSQAGHHHQSSEYKSDYQLHNGYQSQGQHSNSDQYNPHPINTDQCFGRGDKGNFESQQTTYDHGRFNTESKQPNPKFTPFPDNKNSSAATSSARWPSNGHKSAGLVLQRSESFLREQSPMKPKRSLPSVPASDCSDRVKKLTELMKSRMAVRSSSQPKTTLDGSQTYQRRMSSGGSNSDYENVSPTNQSVNKIDQSDFLKRTNGQMVGYLYRTGPDLDYSQKAGNRNWVRAEPYINSCGDHSSNVLFLSHRDKEYFDQSENGNFLEEAPVPHADHSSDSAHTSATSASVLDSGYTTNSESDYMNQQELPVFHPHPLSHCDHIDRNGNRPDYCDSGSILSPKYGGLQNTLNRKQSNLLNTHRFGSVQNISSSQAHGSPKDSRGFRNPRQTQAHGNSGDLNNSTNTIYYPERHPHQFQTQHLPERENYHRSAQSIAQDPKQYFQTNKQGNEGQGRINKPIVVDRYRVKGELWDRNNSNKSENATSNSYAAPGGSPTDGCCSNSSHWSNRQKISLFEIIQKYDLIPVHVRLPQQISLVSLLSLKEFSVSRVVDGSLQNKPASIGGPRSAFTPVRSLVSQDSQPTTTLIGLHNVAWDIHKYSSLGAIETEDLLVEVNGTSCIDATLEQLELTLRRCSGTISLTVARSKETNRQTQAQRIKSLEAEISRLDDILQAREDKIHVLRRANRFKDSFHHIDGELVIAGLELGEDEYVV